MKKITTLFAAAAMAVSASAQTVAESKTFDNVYVGINAGVATKTTGHASWLEDLVPNVGLRIGRNFTPVFGLAAESNVYFKETSGYTTGTIVNYINTSLLGTVNLTNWFGGYGRLSADWDGDIATPIAKTSALPTSLHLR